MTQAAFKYLFSSLIVDCLKRVNDLSRALKCVHDLSRINWIGSYDIKSIKDDISKNNIQAAKIKIATLEKEFRDMEKTKKKLLEKYKLTETTKKDLISILNQALRRAAMYIGDNTNNVHDLIELIKLGACLNSQDDNESKRYTALHWALETGNFINADRLIFLGAKINIRNAADVTALEMIRAMTEGCDKNALLKTCKIRGLIDSDNNLIDRTSNMATFFSQRGQQAPHELSAAESDKNSLIQHAQRR